MLTGSRLLARRIHHLCMIQVLVRRIHFHLKNIFRSSLNFVLEKIGSRNHLILPSSQKYRASILIISPISRTLKSYVQSSIQRSLNWYVIETGLKFYDIKKSHKLEFYGLGRLFDDWLLTPHVVMSWLLSEKEARRKGIPLLCFQWRQIELSLKQLINSKWLLFPGMYCQLFDILPFSWHINFILGFVHPSVWNDIPEMKDDTECCPVKDKFDDRAGIFCEMSYKFQLIRLSAWKWKL